MDSKGNIAIEIGIVLILILIIAGAVLNSAEMSTQKIISESERQHMESITSELADGLINNPGNPENWNELGFGNPGLAVVNDEGATIPNSVSYAKFIALGDDYEKLLDLEFKSSMELIAKKTTISSVKIGSENSDGTVFSTTRLVKCDFFKKYVVRDFQNDGKCNRNHNQEKNSCNYFKVFKGNLRSSNYYLLIDSDEKDLKYYVDTTRIVKERYWNQATSNKIYLKNEIEFYDDTSAVVFVHFDKPYAKAVLVSVPKNFDDKYLKYDYFITNDCEFRLNVWY